MGRTSRATWAKRVERWEQSGLTAKEFATELDVSPKSLSLWKWKLHREGGETESARAADEVTRRRSAGGSTTPARFLELVPGLPSGAPPLEVVFSSGVCVRVPSGFDERTLARVVAILGGA
jgi:transposase